MYAHKLHACRKRKRRKEETDQGPEELSRTADGDPTETDEAEKKKNQRTPEQRRRKEEAKGQSSPFSGAHEKKEKIAGV